MAVQNGEGNWNNLADSSFSFNGKVKRKGYAGVSFLLSGFGSGYIYSIL
jgi:hypothetical protein